MKYIFTIPGVKFFLSEKICQDPLEKFFGCRRQRGSSHDNPNVYEMIKNTQALRVISTVARNVSRENTRGNRGEDPNENIKSQYTVAVSALLSSASSFPSLSCIVLCEVLSTFAVRSRIWKGGMCTVATTPPSDAHARSQTLKLSGYARLRPPTVSLFANH